MIRSDHLTIYRALHDAYRCREHRRGDVVEDDEDEIAYEVSEHEVCGIRSAVSQCPIRLHHQHHLACILPQTVMVFQARQVLQRPLEQAKYLVAHSERPAEYRRREAWLVNQRDDTLKGSSAPHLGCSRDWF